MYNDEGSLITILFPYNQVSIHKNRHRCGDQTEGDDSGEAKNSLLSEGVLRVVAFIDNFSPITIMI